MKEKKTTKQCECCKTNPITDYDHIKYCKNCTNYVRMTYMKGYRLGKGECICHKNRTAIIQTIKEQQQT